MKIALAGAGTAGAYAYRLLKREGFEVDIFDRKRATACGINPCAWGTSRGFFELVRAAGLNPEKYVLQVFDHVLMDEVRIPGELMTFDKPLFIKDLLQGAELKEGPMNIQAYDRVIDASGISRAYLPSIEKDILLPCVQRRVETKHPLENRIKLGGIGYAWCFPLSHYGYHIGCGSLAGNPKAALESLGWLSNPSSQEEGKTLCACTGKLRLTGPHYSLPFVFNGVWGVGEAIGCVAPLAGDGVVPGMKSVKLLLDNWEDPEGYTKVILEEFRWMKNERRVIDKLLSASDLGVKDAWVLQKNSKRMGMRVGLKEAAQLLRALARW